MFALSVDMATRTFRSVSIRAVRMTSFTRSVHALPEVDCSIVAIRYVDSSFACNSSVT